MTKASRVPDLEIVWQTIQSDLPVLHAQITKAQAGL